MIVFRFKILCILIVNKYKKIVQQILRLNLIVINFAFDLISIPPAPILKNLHFRGAAWQIGEMIVPAGLHYCGRENRNE